MKEFNKLIQAKFNEMQKTGKLFRVSLTGQQIWNLYLKSFTKENDPIFRDPASTTHNCNHCNNFVRRYGNIVSVNENYEIVSMFDVEADEEFADTAKQMSKAIKASPIAEVFFETFAELQSLPYEACKKTNEVFQLGITNNVKRYTKEEAEKYGVVKANETRTFNHLNLSLSREYVDMSGKSVESIMGEYRDAKNVFQRAMEVISLDTLNLVKDLINQGSLLDGTTHLYKVEQFIPLKEEYDSLSTKQRDNWCWVKSLKLPFAKFKNELIGVLCTELAEGEELNKACQSWNKRVDPANYMKAVAPFTEKQKQATRKIVEDGGYEKSFDRRFATIDDIKASEILHINVGKGDIKKISIFDGVKSTSTRHKRSEFDGVEEIGIEKFMKDILPSCSSIEAFVGNNLDGNFVSLTTANNPDSKKMFKWDNNYSWTFNGNLAGKSQIKEAVKLAGGNVEGVLNFRLAWNDKNQGDSSDLDLWAREPNNTKIGYSTGFRKDRGNVRTSMSGQLDVDNTNPQGKIAVENITWTDIKKMKDGDYPVWVNPFSARNSKGFVVEIEFDGQTYTYVYDKAVTKDVHVATVTLNKGEFTIAHVLPCTEGEGVVKEVYGLQTNQFHKVNLVCLSPNHWGDNKVGNKHYFFMLDCCKSPTSIRAFHAENLNDELYPERRVLEQLGNVTQIPSTDRQLSGLGFNSTVHDELLLKLSGTHKRVVKIKFDGLDTKAPSKKKVLEKQS